MGIEEEPITGENDDSVRVKIGPTDARIVENYSFESSIFRQPAAFSLTLSGGKGVSDILNAHLVGPKTRVALYIGKYRQFTGELDAANAKGDANSTTIHMKGRDFMARLFDTDITGDQTFNNSTYEALFRAALEDVGQGHKIVEISNTANRKIRAGANVKVAGEPVTKAEVKRGAITTTKGFQSIILAKMGETWLQFLERQFHKIGLFTWSDANGNFVLSRPNGEQAPLYHFYRRRNNPKVPMGTDPLSYRGIPATAANVKSFEYTNDTTRRFSECIIFARNGGRQKGHNHTNGKFVDVEMEALGFKRRRVFRDANVTNAEEATYFARMKIAEINRASVKLQYTISGHSAPTVADSTKRAIIVADTVARIDDHELGIHGNWYVEAVEYHSPPRTTIVTLMRIQDLVFGEEQVKVAVVKAKKAVSHKITTAGSFTINVAGLLARQRGADNPYRDKQ